MKKNRTILMAIIIIPTIIMIPVNLLLIYYAQRQVENARQELLHDNEALLQMYAGTVEKELLQVDNYMQLLTTERYPYQKLAEEGTTSKDPEFYDVQNQLIQELKVYMATNDVVSNVIAYFEPSGVYINRDSFGTQKREKVEALKKVLSGIEEEEGRGLGGNWQYLELGGDVYLMNVYCSPSSRCLITILADDILKGLTQGEKDADYRYYLCFQKDKLKQSGLGLEHLEEKLYENAPDFKREGQKCYHRLVKLYDLDLSLGGWIPQEALNRRIPGIVRILLIFSMVSLCCAPLLSAIFLHLVERPLKLLNHAMDELEQGNTGYRIPVRHKMYENEFDALNLHFNKMMDELENTKLRLYQEEIDRQKIQLRYLNQQIRPHFVLNALNIIYMWDDNEFPSAKKMIIYLTKYFRYLVNLKSDYVLLWEEMEHAENYLKIQKVRYPSRFTHFVEWEEELRYARIPAVVIQTFVENSIKYGFRKGNTMFLFVLAKRIGKDRIQLLIADTGKGFEPDTLQKIQEFLKTKKYDENMGVGIQNVINRLTILYGGNFEISIYNAVDGGARIEIEIPWIVETEGETDDQGTACG